MLCTNGFRKLPLRHGKIINNYQCRIDVILFTFDGILADLTVSKRSETSYRIEIHFAVVNHSYLLFSFVKLVETW